MIKISEIERRASVVAELVKSGKTDEARKAERELWSDSLQAIRELGLLGVGLSPGIAEAALATRDLFKGAT